MLDVLFSCVSIFPISCPTPTPACSALFPLLAENEGCSIGILTVSKRVFWFFFLNHLYVPVWHLETFRLALLHKLSLINFQDFYGIKVDSLVLGHKFVAAYEIALNKVPTYVHCFICEYIEE